MPERENRSASLGVTGGARLWLSRDRWCGLFLVAATFLAYLPALPGKFVWDDDWWTTKITGLLHDASGLWTMWCQPAALQQYYPLTGTTFWLDYHLWGFWTLPYHVENVLLHAFAALLFWRLLRRLQVPGAWLAAAIFALHPVMVESAGWITERKNVLSLAFYLGALLAYGRFAIFGEPTTARLPPRRIPPRASGARMGWRFCCLSPPIWQRRPRFHCRQCSYWCAGGNAGASGGGRTCSRACRSLPSPSAWAWSRPGLEKICLGAKGPEWAFSFPERCLIAGRALWFYTGKLLWPADLCFLYPRWQLNAGSFAQWLYPGAAAGVLLALWLMRGRIGRGPATAAFFFAGTLFPVLGLPGRLFHALLVRRATTGFTCRVWD